MPSREEKYYQDRKLWFTKYLQARDRKDVVGMRRAAKKLERLTNGKFDGTDPNK